jgi:hypothetical protein
MSIQQTPGLLQSPEYAALVTKADSLLASELGQTASATWDLVNDERGRPLLKLKVDDPFSGQGTWSFAPDELRNERHLLSRLHDLKGSLVRTGVWRKPLDDLFSSIRQWSQGLPGAYIQEEPMTYRDGNGMFEASRLLVTSEGHTMQVEPVGSWVVGADGLVNLNGLGGPLTLLYSQKDGGWSYIPKTIPAQSIPLSRELFLELAAECLHG